MEEILTENAKTQQPLVYKVNGVDFLTYGVYISNSEGMFEGLEMKDPRVEEWNGQHGEYWDLDQPRYENRTIELDCFLKGDGKLDYYQKIRAFVQAFQKKGLQKFEVIIADEPLIFMVAIKNGWNMEKAWNDFEMIGTFNFVLTEPQPVKRLLKIDYTGGDDDFSALESDYKSIAYGAGTYVAVSEFGTNKVMTSPNGKVWTARTAPHSCLCVCYALGKFIAVGDNGAIMTSPDGITWTSQTSPNSNRLEGVCAGGAGVVAVASSGTNRVLTSPDGENWTEQTTIDSGYWRAVAYGNGVFVAVSNFGSSWVMTSPDGVTWTDRSIASHPYENIAFGNGLFMITASTGGNNYIYTSPNGITWTAKSAPSGSFYIYDVTYGNGRFLLVGSATSIDRIYTSTNSGTTWIGQDSFGAPTQWNAVVYGTKFVAVSSTTPPAISSSDGGVTWEGMSSSPLEISFTSENAVNIFWGDGQIDYDIYGEDVQLTHDYAENGTYYILITGVIEEITNFETTATVVWNKY